MLYFKVKIKELISVGHVSPLEGILDTFGFNFIEGVYNPKDVTTQAILNNKKLGFFCFVLF